MGIYVAPAGEEEEWKERDGGSGEVKKEDDRDSSSPSSPPPLRANPALATDPAIRAPQEPEQASVSSAAEEEEESRKDGRDEGGVKRRREEASPSPPPTRQRTDPPAPPAPPSTPSPAAAPAAARAHEDLSSPPPVSAGPQVYFCGPCGIRFSSLSTLEAHQTYYCSHRMHALPRVFPGGGAESESEEAKSGADKEETSGGESSSEPSGKAVRTGKQYKCPHCSYSADKKVSLNRHMRMHSASPGVSERSSSPQPAVDRYCQDCDIRFSSSKTFRAHKMHYCSTRHVVKSKGAPSPECASELRPTTPSGGVSPVVRVPPEAPQPFLALPTNPILIVPYSLIQGASLLPAPAAGLHPPDTAYFLLQDGTLQPMATAIPSRPPADKPLRPAPPFHSPPQPLKHEVEKPKVTEPPSGSPLDLSCRRSSEKDVVVVDTSEDEKENRQSVTNTRAPSSPEHEDIICAPSIPLMLSTSSTCSSPSPAPLSPASSTSKRSDVKRPSEVHSNSPSPKSSVVSPAPGVKSPRRTPNGVVKTRPGRQTPDTPKDNNINLQSLLLAAVSAQSQMDVQMKSELQNLPFPTEFLPHLTAMYNARLAKAKGMPPIPGLIPPGGGLPPHPLPLGGRSPAEFLNQASILLTSEMALRLAAVATPADLPPPTPVPPPSVLVKQGDSKCQECNIVFYKHENYIAHKKHYCSARKIESSQDEKTPSPMSRASPPPATPPKEPKAKSPIGPVSSNLPSTSKPTMYQFICAACGIKFTSYDNLTAHQTYYCPKRNPGEPEKPRRCTKCKTPIIGEHHCTGGALGWKCPCCPVTSPTASAAQKHMDTHSGVKAFLCTICRYKGNTLRGMRTHIRMHFDKRPADVNEENYITCIVEDSGSPQNPMEPSVILEEDVVVSPLKDARATPGRKTPCNGLAEPVKIKQEEEAEDHLSDRTEPAPEEEEYIEVEDVTVKEEAVVVKAEEEEPVVVTTQDPPDAGDDPTTATNNNKTGGPRYCESCDISFTYLSTFIAHKKFYCSNLATESASVSNNNNSSSNNNNHGTPVT